MKDIKLVIAIEIDKNGEIILQVGSTEGIFFDCKLHNRTGKNIQLKPFPDQNITEPIKLLQ